MDARRPLVAGLGLLGSAWLLAAAVPAAAVNNNLNLLPSRGVQFGNVMRSGKTIKVKLERSRPPSELSNNSGLVILNVLPGTGAQAVFTPQSQIHATPFDEVFPNGAYSFYDPNHDLYSWRGCFQAASGAAWDNSRVYCAKDGIAKIKITTGPGEYDTIAVDAAVVVPLSIRCSGRQDLCGTNCLSPETHTCCDTTTGCFASGGFTCADQCP